MQYLKPIVFISSTVKDLPNERAGSKRAVEKLQCIPLMSEYTMNAVDKPSVQACIDAVKSADFYILIIGTRYGWELENGISITELEFDTAYKEKKPIFVYNLKNEKEEKQQIFANKVGTQRFWKEISDAFELEEEIIKSITQFLQEKQYEKQESTEKLFSNLLEIEFPRYIYRATLNIDRKDIIKKSKNTQKWLKQSATTFDVLVSAFKQMNINPPGDWALFENSIITFHDLSNTEFPLTKVIDLGTVESFACDEFYSTNEDYNRVFKYLLRKCFSRKLHHLNIKYYSNSGVYVYMQKDDNSLKRQERWHSKNDATRTVFEMKMNKKDSSKVFYCKHLALCANFYDFDGKWFVCISPEWFITFDGKKESYYGYKQISYLKKKERNNQVFNHLKFIVYQLKQKVQDDLFTKSFDYKFLTFKSLDNVLAYPALDDNNWYQNESNASKSLLLDTETPITLFD
jgi:hypothetical protein